MSPDRARAIPVGDIGETVEDDNYGSDNAQIVVLHLDRYKSCLRCKARVEPSDAGMCNVADF